VREVLDLVEEHTEPGRARDELLSHWYKGKMLGRVGGRRYAYMPRRDPEYRRELYEQVRGLALERFDASIDEWLAPSLRVRSHLLREGEFDSLQALAAMEGELRIDAKAQAPRGHVVPFEARMVGDREPLRFRRDGERIVWLAPDGVALPDGWLDVTETLPAARIDLVLRRTSDKTEYLLPSEVTVRLDEVGGGAIEPVLTGEARLAPEALAGGPLPEGRWEVLAVMTVVGFTATNRLRDARSAAPVKFEVDGTGQVRRAGGGAAARASLAGRAARRMPGLARVVRRAVRATR
jgi:hypothetical protein